MNNKSIIPIIEANYNNFTQLERNIADFFLKNQEKADLSSKKVAGRLFVSEASLSRFAKKCGFRGYREFIYQYEDTLDRRDEILTRQTRTVLNLYQELLNKTYSLMDESQILRVVAMLNEAERVFACGKGSSGLAASEMESRFMRIGVDIDSLQDSDRIRMQAVFQKKGRLVSGISLSGETEEIVYILKEAHRRGAGTVLMTANNREEFALFCDEVILVPSLTYLNHGNLISPQYPLLIMLDIIYGYYVGQDKDGRGQMHDNTLRALRDGREGKRIRM